MAVVKLKYLRARPQLKRHLRYITHRRGSDGASITRALFTSQGLTEKRAFYEVIDSARRGTVFYKFMINPDPRREDTYKDLDLGHLTRQTILALQKQLGFTLPFVATIHSADHSSLRHIHGIFLLPRRITREAFQALRKLAYTTATAQARLQRRGLDLARGNPRSLRLNRYKVRTQGRPQPGRIRQPVRLKQWGRGYRPTHLQGGCRSCGFGLTTGISVFLSVCPLCGRGLRRQALRLSRSL